MRVLTAVLIFRNILPCKLSLPLNLFFLIVWLWFSCYYPFFKVIFSPRILWVPDIVRAQNCFVFIFTNLIQIQEKTHVPVTVRFPDYAFNENIYNVMMFIWNCLLIFFRPSKVWSMLHHGLLRCEFRIK